LKDLRKFDEHLIEVVYQSVAIMYNQHPSSGAIRTRGQDLSHLSSSKKMESVLDMVQSAKLSRSDLSAVLSVLQFLSPTGARAVALGNTMELQNADTVKLPKPQALRMRFDDVMRQRRSCRDFAPTALTLKYVSTLMHYTAGISGEVVVSDDGENKTTMPSRTYPSGGGLYPVEINLICNNVAGTVRGVYRYLPLQHGLSPVETCGEVDTILSGFSNVPSPVVSDVPLILLLVVNLPRVLSKYGPRGLRLAWQEMGYIAQNIGLTGNAIGLGTLDYSSFHDAEIDQSMGLDGKFSSVSHSILIGHHR